MTSIILLAVGIVVGVPLGALWCARRRDQAPIELPAHEHLWAEWEHLHRHVLRNSPDAVPSGYEMVQRRSCYTCGFTEYHTDRL
ncbi:hypothetical protein PQI66_09940 [Corynebacterium sp. USCH3]|uniref:hypothetical protein n=1 Tax=Corynebacterium sp. USCH3 TaxID=3024840 RepID=UPI00309A315F